MNNNLNEIAIENARLKDLIKQFFDLLDATETTDDGREFHPVTINCCRALTIPKLDKVLLEMKKLICYKSSDGI